jgi:hypothetical protein
MVEVELFGKGAGGGVILTQGLIGLIKYSYHQGIPSFPETQLKKL